MVTLEGMNTHYIWVRKTLENQIQIMQRIYFPLLICFTVILARVKNSVLSRRKKWIKLIILKFITSPQLRTPKARCKETYPLRENICSVYKPTKDYHPNYTNNSFPSLIISKIQMKMKYHSQTTNWQKFNLLLSNMGESVGKRKSSYMLVRV